MVFLDALVLTEARLEGAGRGAGRFWIEQEKQKAGGALRLHQATAMVLQLVLRLSIFVCRVAASQPYR